MPIALSATVAVAAAMVNWATRFPTRSRWLDSPWVEWISKPLATLALIAAAINVDAADPAQRQWFVAGLILCLSGDVALMLPTELFRTGLVSFLLGHLAFVVGFVLRGELVRPAAVAVGAAVLVCCLGVGVRHLLPNVRRNEPTLFPPVLAYVAVIATMAVASWWGEHGAAPIGAATFAVSDLTLADNKFVSPRRWWPLAVMVTYHSALALLVWSLL